MKTQKYLPLMTYKLRFQPEFLEFFWPCIIECRCEFMKHFNFWSCPWLCFLPCTIQTKFFFILAVWFFILTGFLKWWKRVEKIHFLNSCTFHFLKFEIWPDKNMNTKSNFRKKCFCQFSYLSIWIDSKLVCMVSL